MDDPYSSREVAQLFKAAEARADEFRDTLMERMDKFETDVRNALTRLEIQTAKTNGRVTKLETWQAYVLGFCACITVLVVPVLLLVAKKYLDI